MVRRIVESIQWRNAATQLLLIVTGVLVALAAQSLWNRHQDRQQEAEYLRQLRSDLVEAVTSLDSVITNQARSTSHLARMRQFLHSSGEAPPTDSLTLWLGHSLQQPNLHRGTLNALLESGDIRLIGDDSIRIPIIRYGAVLDRFDNGFGMDRDAYMERSANARASMEHYTHFAPVSWQDTAFKAASYDVNGFRADPAARAAFNSIYLAVRNSARKLVELRDETKRLIDTIDGKKTEVATTN